jgi:hypothetical protein
MIFCYELITEQLAKNQSKEFQNSLVLALISTLKNSSSLITVTYLLEIFKITIHLILSVRVDDNGLLKLESLLDLCCSHSLFNLKEFVEFGKVLLVFFEACNKYGLEILIGSSLSFPLTSDSNISQINIFSFDSLQLLFRLYMQVLKSVVHGKQQHHGHSEMTVFYTTFFEKIVSVFCNRYFFSISTICSVCHTIFHFESNSLDFSAVVESVPSPTLGSSFLLVDTPTDYQLKKTLFFSLFQYVDSVSDYLVRSVELSSNSFSFSESFSFSILPSKLCESEILASGFHHRSQSFLRDVAQFLQVSSCISVSEMQVVTTKVIACLNLLSDILKREMLLPSFEHFCLLSCSNYSLTSVTVLTVWNMFLLAFLNVLLSCRLQFPVSSHISLSNLFSWSLDNCSFHIIVKDHLYRLVHYDSSVTKWLISFVSDSSEISRLSYSLSSSSSKFSNKVKARETTLPKRKKSRVKEQSGLFLFLLSVLVYL